MILKIFFILGLFIAQSSSSEWICTTISSQFSSNNYLNEQCTITIQYIDIEQEKHLCLTHTLTIASLPPLSLSTNHTMQMLKINFCQLSTLAQLPFSLPSTVETLDLSYNNLSSFVLAFPLPTNLRYLNLDSNPNLIEIDFGNPRVQQRLIGLSLRHNHHVQISSFPLHLTELDLTDCNLSQSSIFPLLISLTKLTHLSLANNQLEHLPSLNEHIQLVYLNVSNNRLTTIEDRWLDRSLQTLDLNFNQIQSLEFLQKKFTIFSNQVMINHTLRLSLFGNPLICDCWLGSILDISSIIISDLHRIQCHSRSIVNISRNDFLCSYSRHCASDCSCCEFEACDCHFVCPSECSCEHDIQWSHHRVQCPNGNLTNVHLLLPQTITELDYRENQIEQIKPFAFVGKTSLIKLNLARNRLKDLTNDTFCAASHLREINLSDNPDLKNILPIIDETFRCLKELQSVILSKDQINKEAKISHGWMVLSNSNDNAVRLTRVEPKPSVLSTTSTILSVLLSATNRPIRNSPTRPVTSSSLYQQECTTFIPATIATIIRHVPFLQHNQTLIIVVFFLLLFVLLFLILLITLAICRRKLRRHLTAELQRQRSQHYYYHHHTGLRQPPVKSTDGQGVAGTSDSLYEQLPSLSSDSEQPFLYNEKKCHLSNAPVVPPYPPIFRHHLCCHPTGRLLHPSPANTQEYQYVTNATTTTGYSTPTSQQHQCAAILVWANRLLYPTQNAYNHGECPAHSCPSELQQLQQCLLTNPSDQTSMTAENSILRYCNNEALLVPATNCTCAGHGQNSDTYIYPHVHR